ncbi:MAG: hypothetical protein HJJLKODD_00847 [Phycisphaerae bacterium]|nr:hypothetical protein [Phycisphaerae bacterium]
MKHRSMAMGGLMFLLIGYCGCMTPPVPVQLVARSSLLFDNLPSEINAEDLSGWRSILSAPADQYRDQVWFREVFYDVQGQGFWWPDYNTRRFQSVREGSTRR